MVLHVTATVELRDLVHLAQRLVEFDLPNLCANKKSKTIISL